MASRPGFARPSLPQVRSVASHVAAAVASTRRTDVVPRSPAQLKPQASPVRATAPHLTAQIARAQAALPAPAHRLRAAPLGILGAGTLQPSKKKRNFQLDQGGDEQYGGTLDKFRVKNLNRQLVSVETGTSNLSMYEVPFQNLPTGVQAQITAIRQAPGVYWEHNRGAHIASDGNHLPWIDIGAIPRDTLSQKQLAYLDLNSYDKFDNQHQFIEYEVPGSGRAFRLLYDFYWNRFYATTTHYNTWHDGGNNLRNPFLRVSGV